MARLKLTLEYDGSGLRGWAAQPGLRTVQGVVEEALATVFPRWEQLAVAGRTDTGVHALGQVASVEVDGGPQLVVSAAARRGAAGRVRRPSARRARLPRLYADRDPARGVRPRRRIRH